MAKFAICPVDHVIYVLHTIKNGLSVWQCASPEAGDLFRIYGLSENAIPQLQTNKCRMHYNKGLKLLKSQTDRQIAKT